MTTLHYKVVDHDPKHTEYVEEHFNLDLKRFAEACDQSPEWVMKLIEYDILTKPEQPHAFGFTDEDIARAHQVSRLQRDFDASFSAVAMMLDLIDEVQQLRREVKHAQFKH